MAFNIFKWLTGSKDTESATKAQVKDFLDNDEGTAELAVSFYVQRLAFWSVVRKIGSAIAAIEWQTYRRNKKVKAREYWAWNYDPNPNQTREEFFQKLVAQLYTQQEALVVEYYGYRYVADSFTVQEKPTGNIYSGITIGDETIATSKTASEVLHFTLNGDSINNLLTVISGMEGRLLKSAVANYIRSQGMRGILRIDELAEADADFEDVYADLVNNKFKKYFSAENAVLPLFKGYEFEQQESTGGSTKSSLSGTRDIRSMMDDVVDFTAQAIGIPTSIVTGKDVTDADFKAFMTSPVQPLVKMIANEMNRKIYGRDLVFAGTRIEPSYAGVRHIDIFDVANPIDKLISSGAFCVNDIRMHLGLEVINENWAWQHYMTKNYSTVEDILNGVDDNSTLAETQPEEEDNTDE